ncbi:MAG TPA: ATP synthase F1 subunit epsilon [Candidatus Dormibacteraeota bacterium]
MPVSTRLLSALRPLFEGDCDFIVAQGADGELGVLPGHSPVLTWLKPGELMLRQGREETHYFLESGYLEVLPDRVLILAERGQAAGELDPAAAEEIRRESQEALSRARASEPEAIAELERELDVAERRLQAAERAQRRQRD